jgi:hypothetical protein
MEFEVKKCPKCGKNNLILPSNNPLVESVCNNCIVSKIKYDDLERADFFCRTYNLPFYPERWIKLSNIYKENVFKEYISEMNEIHKEAVYKTKVTDIWKEASREWELIQTHGELIAKIEPIKEGYILRNKIKWGADYTFQELIHLEDLFMNTLRANDISNPMQTDAIKKACKISVALDKAIVGGDSKEMNELSKAYQNFIKTAKIDEIITAASKDVISNVAELVDFIEKSGYQFQYYDGVERDIVDKSINDIKEYIRRVIIDTTGLEITFEAINDTYKKELEIQKDAESYEKVPLEKLYENVVQRTNDEFDEELDNDEIDEGFFDEDDEDEYFG